MYAKINSTSINALTSSNAYAHKTQAKALPAGTAAAPAPAPQPQDDTTVYWDEFLDPFDNDEAQEAMKEQQKQQKQKFKAVATIRAAITSGDSKQVSAALATNARNHVNAYAEDGTFPLYMAVEQGDMESIRLIIKRGGRVALVQRASDNSTPFNKAVEKGDAALLEYLFKAAKTIDHVRPNSSALIFENLNANGQTLLMQVPISLYRPSLSVCLSVSVCV